MSLRGSLTARMMALAIVIALLVGGAIAALVLTIGDLRETTRLSARSRELLVSANRAEKLVLDLQTGPRGFRLTRNERFLAPWRTGRLLLSGETQKMTSLAVGKPAQEALAQQIADGARAYLEEYSIPVVEAVRAGREPPPVSEDKRRVDALREQFARFDAREERESAALASEADDAAARSAALGTVVLGAGVALLVGFALYLGRAVALPVSRAAAAADRMASGDLAVRLPVRGRDELARLSSSFNDMGRSLEESRDEIESQHAELADQTAELEAQQEQLADANDELRAQRDQLERTSSALAEDTERQRLFNEFARGLAANSALADRAERTLRTLADLAGGEVGALYAAIDDAGFELLEVRGLDAERLPDTIGPADGLAGRALAECRTTATTHGDGSLRLRAFGRETTVRHELHVPLTDGKHPVGVVSLGRTDERGFSSRERELVEALAGQAALSLDNAVETRRAERLADVNRAVLDTVRDGIMLTDLDDRIVLANLRAEELAQEILGLSLEQGMSFDRRRVAERLVDPESYAIAEQKIAAAPDEPSFDELELAESGRVLQRFTAPVHDEAGARVGRMTLLREVTAEREAERVKDDLMATVSHELRTPLASIVGFTELLLARDADAATRRAHLETVHREAQRLTRLIDDFLDLQRVSERGRIPLEREPVDLRSIVSDQARVFSGHSRVHDVDVHLPDEPLLAEADVNRLKQVLANLLSNAIKYSPDGGRIGVDGWTGDGKVGVAVLDSGLGIPRAQQPRIFERFYRTPDASRRAIGGTGLGLSLAREIVEAHDGRMGFESVEGQGSRFWFELPAVR